MSTRVMSTGAWRLLGLACTLAALFLVNWTWSALVVFAGSWSWPSGARSRSGPGPPTTGFVPPAEQTQDSVLAGPVPLSRLNELFW